MNRVRDYRALEHEYISGTMSLRELCRAQGITAHSAVMVQARQGGWAVKRDVPCPRLCDLHRAPCRPAAIREAEVRDSAIEAIDEAITKFRSDLRATKRVVLADGSIADEPLMLITPRDLAMMIDRLQILFGRPALITEGRSFAATITSEALPLEALQKIVELTRGLTPPADHTSGLPHIREKLPD